MSFPNAPATRREQFGFLRDAHRGPSSWKALCLSLARQAPGLPAIYPSAKSAMEATPRNRRYPLAKAKRGMVAYFADPDDGNPFDHIVTVAMWDGCDACLSPDDDVFYDDDAHDHSGDLDDLLVWTNDAARTGGVDMVRASFFPEHWGDPFAFATDWLNGYDLPGYDERSPTPAKPPSIGQALDHAIADVAKALRRKRAKLREAREAGDTKRAKGLRLVVAALAEDLGELRETRRKFPA